MEEMYRKVLLSLLFKTELIFDKANMLLQDPKL